MLAQAHALNGEAREALHALAMAYQHFPAHPETDPHFVYGAFGTPWLYQMEGQTRLALDQPVEAWKAFAQVGSLHPTKEVPERIRLESVNHQAEAAIALNDLEQ